MNNITAAAAAATTTSLQLTYTLSRLQSATPSAHTPYPTHSPNPVGLAELPPKTTTIITTTSTAAMTTAQGAEHLYNQEEIDFREQMLAFYNETREFERLVGIIIPSIFTLVIVVGLIGNLLVIVVALNRQMRSSTNTLIIGLTCSDLMFLTLCVPFTAIDYAFPAWVLPTWTCKVINYLQHASAYFSVWTLTLMAGDRFLAVCYPVESMTMRNPSNTVMVLLATYAVILLSQVQVGRIHDVYSYTFVVEERTACAIVSIATGEATELEARLYFFSFNLFGYVMPLGITCVFYYFMLRRLWHLPKPGQRCSSETLTSANNPNANSQSNKINSRNNSSVVMVASNSKASISSVSCGDAKKSTGNGGTSTLRPHASVRSRPETVRAKRKVTRLVMCVVVTWALCWLPLNICFFFSGLVYPDTLVSRGGKAMVLVQIASQVLAYTNSCLNPILYPLVSENFRKGFLRVVCIVLNWLTCGYACRQMKQRLGSRLEVTLHNNNFYHNNTASDSGRQRGGSQRGGRVCSRNTSHTQNLNTSSTPLEQSSLLVRGSMITPPHWCHSASATEFGHHLSFSYSTAIASARRLSKELAYAHHNNSLDHQAMRPLVDASTVRNTTATVEALIARRRSSSARLGSRRGSSLKVHNSMDSTDTLPPGRDCSRKLRLSSCSILESENENAPVKVDVSAKSEKGDE